MKTLKKFSLLNSVAVFLLIFCILEKIRGNFIHPNNN